MKVFFSVCVRCERRFEPAREVPFCSFACRFLGDEEFLLGIFLVAVTVGVALAAAWGVPL